MLLYQSSGEADDFGRFINFAHDKAVIRILANTDSQTFADRIFADTATFVRDHFPSRVKVGIAGGMIGLTKALNDVIVREKIVNIIVITTIIFLIASIVFRSFVAGIYIIVPCLMAVIVNFGTMGFTKTWLNMATASITALTVSIGADYSIYFLFRYREELRKGMEEVEAIRTTLLTSGKAIFFVAMAIAAGYAVLLLSGLLYHRQLGGFVALSMIVASASAITIIPSFILIAKPRFLRNIHGARIPKDKPIQPCADQGSSSEPISIG
jgi:hypothetical protein